MSIGKSAAAYRYFAGLAEDLVVEERRSSQGAHAIVRREPVGVALLLVPWNGPQSLLSWKLAPALAAGCTVVIKPSPETTLDAYVLMELVMEADVPAGVVNMVPGAVNTGRLLVASPGIDKVAFTGSTTAGRAIAVACAERLVPATLELGGKSAAILLDDVDIDSFADQIIGVCSPNVGQVCRACARVLVPESMYERAVEVVAEAMAGGSWRPELSTTVFGPLVSARQRDRVEDFVRIGIAEGATVVTGGHRRDDLGSGYYYAPTSFATSRTTCVSPGRRSSDRLWSSCPTATRTTLLRSRTTPITVSGDMSTPGTSSGDGPGPPHRNRLGGRELCGHDAGSPVRRLQQSGWGRSWGRRDSTRT